MAITARIQNTRSARRTALRAARQERCASATRSSAAACGHGDHVHHQRFSAASTPQRRRMDSPIGRRAVGVGRNSLVPNQRSSSTGWEGCPRPSSPHRRGAAHSLGGRRAHPQRHRAHGPGLRGSRPPGGGHRCVLHVRLDALRAASRRPRGPELPLRGGHAGEGGDEMSGQVVRVAPLLSRRVDVVVQSLVAQGSDDRVDPVERPIKLRG